MRRSRFSLLIRGGVLAVFSVAAFAQDRSEVILPPDFRPAPNPETVTQGDTISLRGLFVSSGNDLGNSSAIYSLLRRLAQMEKNEPGSGQSYLSRRVEITRLVAERIVDHALSGDTAIEAENAKSRELLCISSSAFSNSRAGLAGFFANEEAALASTRSSIVAQLESSIAEADYASLSQLASEIGASTTVAIIDWNFVLANDEIDPQEVVDRICETG